MVLHKFDHYFVFFLGFKQVCDATVVSNLIHITVHSVFIYSCKIASNDAPILLHHHCRMLDESAHLGELHMRVLRLIYLLKYNYVGTN